MSRGAKAQLASEILLTYVSARWHLRSQTLPRAVASLREVGHERAHGPISGDEGERLGRAVSRTLARLPADSRCLVRSLVLLRLLARRGVEAALVIAARPGLADGLDAHAWVEVAGRPVLAPADFDQGRLVTL